LAAALEAGALAGAALRAAPARARALEGRPGKKGSGRKLSREQKAAWLRSLTDEEREALGEEEEAETAEGEEEAETAEADDEDDAADDLDVTERTEVKALMERGREKGFLTYEEVNDALPSDIVSSDQIDDVMSMFGEHDIEVVDDAKKMKLPDKPPEPEAKAADAAEEKE
jgi:RNA polymerase primary sigma factor